MPSPLPFRVGVIDGRSGYTLSLTNTCNLKTKCFPKFNWTRVNLDDQALETVEKTLKNGLVSAIIIESTLSEGGDFHLRPEFFRHSKV